MVVFNAPVPFGRPRGNMFNINYEYNREPHYVPYDQFVAALPGYEAYRKSDTSIPRAKGSDVWKDVVLPKVIAAVAGKVFRTKTGGTEAEALADNEIAEGWIKSATEKVVNAVSPTEGLHLLNNLASADSIAATVRAHHEAAVAAAAAAAAAAEEIRRNEVYHAPTTRAPVDSSGDLGQRPTNVIPTTPAPAPAPAPAPLGPPPPSVYVQPEGSGTSTSTTPAGATTPGGIGDPEAAAARQRLQRASQIRRRRRHG